MSKSKDFRPRRRRGFDDDFEPPHGFEQRRSPSWPTPAPQAGTPPQGPSVKAVVKWFNQEKGFGFVELAEGRGDAFLHINVLQSGGHGPVLPGTTLQVQVGQGPKGAQITSVQSLDASTATEAPARPAPRGGGRPRVDQANAVPLSGRVKWFNTEKGFGFVACDDGLRDVFVHISVLQAAGLQSLNEGQQVDIRVVETPKGREAVSLQLADAGTSS